MKTKEILSIAALVAIALCLICGVAKTAIKSPKQKQSCDIACSLLIFVAVVLVGISQLLGEIGTPLGPGFLPGNPGGPCRTATNVSQCVMGGQCKDGKCPFIPAHVAIPDGDLGGNCLPKGRCHNNLKCNWYDKCEASIPIQPQPKKRGEKGGACVQGLLGTTKTCNTGLHCNNLIPPTCVENPPGPTHFIKPRGEVGDVCGNKIGGTKCSQGLLCKNGKCALGGPCPLGMCLNGGTCTLDPISSTKRCF